MNVEIAQRLAQLRREKGYSQEELAENLGLSRQAVSKWERAESSPDTGNLVALAKLYGITLDDLLSIEADIEDDVKFEAHDRVASSEAKAQIAAEQANVAAVQAQAAAAQAQAAQAQTFHAQTTQAQGASAQTAQAQATQAYTYPAQVPPANPYAGQATVPPVVQSTVPMAPPAPIQQEKKHKGPWSSFPYPVLCVVLFFCAGFFMHAWHPAWVLFLTIPLYYWVAHIIENDPNYRK